MPRAIVCALLLLVAAALAPSPAVAQSTPPVAEGVQRVSGVDVEVHGEGRRVVFHLSEPPGRVTYFRLDGPPRLVIDVHGRNDSRASVERFRVDDAIVASVRVGHHEGWLRLVVDLEADAPTGFAVRGQEHGLVAYVGEVAESASASDQAHEAGGESVPASY